jgi:hypothetical protein
MFVGMADLPDLFLEGALSCAVEQACRMAEVHEPLLESLPTTSSERMQLISGREAGFSRKLESRACNPARPRSSQCALMREILPLAANHPARSRDVGFLDERQGGGLD